MKRRCIICGYSSNLHSFPKDPLRKNEWANALGINTSEIRTRDAVCDDHFSSNQYKGDRKLWLKNDATPTLQPFNDAVEEQRNRSESNEVGNKQPKFVPRKCVLCKDEKPLGYLHKFPEDSNRRNEWAKALGISKICKRDKVCNAHFSDNQFKGPTKKHLKDDAVPYMRSELVSENGQILEEIPYLPCSSEMACTSSPQQVSITEFSPTKRHFRTFGEITESDVLTPRRSTTALYMGREALEKLRRKCKVVQAQNYEMQKKISRLETQLAEAERLRLISAQASNNILVNDL